MIKRTRKATISLILDALRRRGWREPDDLALVIVEAMEARGGRYDSAILASINSPFFTRNNVTRTEVGGELARVLASSELRRGQATPLTIKILFLAANPIDQAGLRLDEEVRQVGLRLRLATYRDRIELKPHLAARPGDLIEALNLERAQILHFSGHGSDNDELVFQGDAGETRLVSLEAVLAAIATVSDEVQIVVLNACHSAQTAAALVKHVPASIAMTDAISDDAAREFAGQFYSSLAYGRSLQTAFDQACASLMLAGLNEEDTPVLAVGTGVDPTTLTLV